ncbi:MAG: hypothetical protein GWN99_02315 [Gemmatimonadetes bacterium]|uniref:Lipoprotein n=1 Tax=Candidatus Kutchimonas denitrificans TaxID=3056748 RepID=A0AAE5CCX7_9BACT|nr:hypothetical protein [Gemmatimonadota bacterium]NIR74789.1 hypothetical protein [Candidatus Kutchimonas denitrificans]NIR99900.1 hypothetical protein [Gemmatimonadota bacterium]NIT65484.1 hypothetical protein [Gemmatimonadota bacterium]NIU52454.1 hypothetical protein [Gemmatimonadota bacterium]
MKTRPIVFLSLGAIVGLAACDDPVFDDPAILELSVQVAPKAIYPGDTTWLTVRATNPTSRPFRFSGYCGLLGFTIRTEAGDLVVIEPPPCVYPILDAEERSGSYDTTIGPRQTVSRVFLWTGERRFYGGGLAPGDYRIVATASSTREPVQSEPVALAILPIVSIQVRTTPAAPVAGQPVRIDVEGRNGSGRAVTIPAFPSCGFGAWVKRDERFSGTLAECPVPQPMASLAPRRSHR